MSPQQAEVGERTCFQFSVAGAQGRPRAGARVRFLGRRARSGANGRARICAAPRWPGVHTAWVSRGSHRPEKLEVTARGESNVAGGAGWHRFVVHFDAYGDWGRCSTNYGDASAGSCRGRFQCCGWNTTPPFHDSDGAGSTFEWGSGRPMAIGLYNALSFYHRAKGFVAGPESGALTITGGSSGGWYPGAWGWEVWPITGQDSKLQSGTDTSKLGQPGGPIRISVTYRAGGPFSNPGYTVDLNGYLWY